MNRRGFLKFLGAATVGTTVAYSFPSIIVPKNIITLDEVATDVILNDGTSLNYINEIIKKEIYPRVLRDNFFTDSPFLARMRSTSEHNLDFSKGHISFKNKLEDAQIITPEEEEYLRTLPDNWDFGRY